MCDGNNMCKVNEAFKVIYFNLSLFLSSYYTSFKNNSRIDALSKKF